MVNLFRPVVLSISAVFVFGAASVLLRAGIGLIPAVFIPLGMAGLAGHPLELLRRNVQRDQRLRGLCVSCGYDLTGNAGGVCPECGSER